MRARHWLALLAAFSLIVVAWRTTDARPGGDVAADVDPTATTDEANPGVEETAGPTIRNDETDVELEQDAAAPDVDGTDPEPAGQLVDGTARNPEDDEPTGPTGPLTGLPVEPEVLERPALVMKIDNHPRARPQTGLDRADIVFDLRAEGVTRFAAVFHSDVPDPLGPVRSSRTSDFDLLRGMNEPLYGSSGGNNYVAGALRSLPITPVTAMTRQEYFRNRSRPAPHNLYVNGTDLLALAPSTAEPPPAWFRYRREGDELPSAAAEVVGPVTVDFTGSPTVTHEWDAERNGWLRAQDGTPHAVADGDQMAPENVVIMITDYSTSAADPISPEVRSTGSGPVIVLTDGHVITGTWDRPDPEDTPTLTTEGGDPIALTPGRTWVLMPEEGQVTIEVAEVAATGTARTSGSLRGRTARTAGVDGND